MDSNFLSSLSTTDSKTLFSTCTRFLNENATSSKYNIYIVTWNVAAKGPPKDLDQLIGTSPETIASDMSHIYTICLQEVQDLSKIIAFEEWTNALTEKMAKYQYYRVKVVKMIGLLMLVFVRKSYIKFITNVESGYTKTGFKGYWGNKGAVAVRFQMEGVYICIMNCHLAAHSCDMTSRINDYHTIVQNLKFRYSTIETILDHDYVFCVGDLNFRFLSTISDAEVKSLIAAKDYKTLINYDQLYYSMKNKLMLLDFVEGEIKFNPTYKYDIGTDTYDTSVKNRCPAWCDRILWMYHEIAFEGIKLKCEQLNYTSDMTNRISDHKPVSSEFVIDCLTHPPKLPIKFEKFTRKNLPGNSLLVKYLMPYDKSVLHSGDWIGLYKESFTHDTDYVRFVYIEITDNPVTLTASVSFPASMTVTLKPGEYRCCYFSYIKDCLIGYSDIFKFEERG